MGAPAALERAFQNAAEPVGGIERVIRILRDDPDGADKILRPGPGRQMRKVLAPEVHSAGDGFLQPNHNPVQR